MQCDVGGSGKHVLEVARNEKVCEVLCDVWFAWSFVFREVQLFVSVVCFWLASNQF